MNRKIVAISIIIGGFLAVIFIVYIIFFHDFSKVEYYKGSANNIIENLNSEEKEGNVFELENKEDNKKDISTKFSSSNSEKEVLKKMAASFSERFGSFSNHSDYSNIADLKIFMSEKMKSWSDDYIDEIRSKKEYSDIFYGMTTKAISEEIKLFDKDSGKAEILVYTKRKESTGSMENSSSFYKNILIKFVEENGSWKVDDASWIN